MIINSPKGVPWSEVQKLIDDYYSGKNVLAETDAWDMRVLRAISKIRKIVEDLPDKDREIQTESLWREWQDKNPKPKSIDKISRHQLTKKMKPARANDLKECYDFLTAYTNKWKNPTDEMLKEEAANTLRLINELKLNSEEQDSNDE